jgi:hypothetical protein
VWDSVENDLNCGRKMFHDTKCSVRIPPEDSGERHTVMIAKGSAIPVLNKIIARCFSLTYVKVSQWQVDLAAPTRYSRTCPSLSPGISDKWS